MKLFQSTVRRVVIKVGTNTLTTGEGFLNEAKVRALSVQIAELKKQGLDVIVVSSGAVGMGMGQLKFKKRPADLPTLQACAAIGQSLLVQCWQKELMKFGFHSAQVLLTREDVQGRKRHLAVRNTLERLLKLNVIPIINENDTVSADEIKFGDNDVLSALVASFLKADLLVIISTIPGLLNRESGELVEYVSEITPEIRALAGGSESETSTGGMVTKIEAAAIATNSGSAVFIGDGNDDELLIKLSKGEAIGTSFAPGESSLASRKRWIAYFEKPKGDIQIDAGAVQALSDQGSSLLAKGITHCSGTFEVGSIVNLRTPSDEILGRGICQFSSRSIREIMGLSSEEIRKRFPEQARLEVIHRDGLVML